MAISIEDQIRLTLRLLEDVLQFYSQFLDLFDHVPASCHKLTHTLSKLKRALSRFKIKFNACDEFLLVYVQLTSGLNDCLVSLKHTLIAYSDEHDAGLRGSNGRWQQTSAIVMQRMGTRLQAMTISIEILNEAIEQLVQHGMGAFIHLLTSRRALRKSIGIKSSKTEEEIWDYSDEAKSISAQLRRLLHSFVYGISVQPKLNTCDGEIPNAFSISNISHRELGQSIGARLQHMVKEGINTRQDDEGLIPWKIRHSIYWLSRSCDDLCEWTSENGLSRSYQTARVAQVSRESISKIFLNAIKAAWLLGDLGDLRSFSQPSFEMQKVIGCTEKRVLSLLQKFYTEIFRTPSYDVINKLRTYDICTEDEQEQKPCQPFESFPIVASQASEPEVLSVDSNSSSAPLELEASYPALSTCSNPLLVPSDLMTVTLMEHQSTPSLSNDGSSRTTEISELAEGLHIIQLEDSNAQFNNVDHVAAGLQQDELMNAETGPSPRSWTGFQNNMWSIETNPPHDKVPLQTCVRIFKAESFFSSYLHSYTYREGLPAIHSIIQPSTAKLIPNYAFATDNSDCSELYISDSEMPPSLRYQFRCTDPRGNHYPWELYGFQGALMNAYFEGDYCAQAVIFRRCGSRTAERERFPRIQVWTDFQSDQSLSSDPSSPTGSPGSSASSSPVSSISSKDFSALTSRFTSDANDSKMYIFAGRFIYVLIGSFTYFLRHSPMSLIFYPSF